MKPASSQIAEYLELESKATAGPWSWWYDDKEMSDIVRADGNQWLENVIVRDAGVYPPDVPTCEFIIASRDIGVKCARALQVAIKTLEEIKAMECVCDIFGHKQCAQCEAYIALKKIDSIFNPGDAAGNKEIGE